MTQAEGDLTDSARVAFDQADQPLSQAEESQNENGGEDQEMGVEVMPTLADNIQHDGQIGARISGDDNLVLSEISSLSPDEVVVPETLTMIFGGIREWWLDVHWLVGFIIAFCAWVALGIYCLTKGDLNFVHHPTDSYGNLCGVGKLEASPKLIYFDLMACIDDFPSYHCLSMQVCIKKCPDFYFSPLHQLDLNTTEGQERTKNFLKPYCSPEYEASVSVEELVNVSAMRPSASSESLGSSPPHLFQDQICPRLLYPSTDILERCIPLITFSVDEQFPSSNPPPEEYVISHHRSLDKPPQSKEAYEEPYKGVSKT
jgi:hypothetical protein